eukprot:SAG25_NODE_285_length_10382_cov_55.777108_5_plen_82_part_00
MCRKRLQEKKVPDNVHKSVVYECRKQSISVADYVAKPRFKCLCQDHFESLEVKKTVDELPLKTGKVRKASRLSSKTVGPRL